MAFCFASQESTDEVVPCAAATAYVGSAVYVGDGVAIAAESTVMVCVALFELVPSLFVAESVTV